MLNSRAARDALKDTVIAYDFQPRNSPSVSAV
jgi:hypothetical protein